MSRSPHALRPRPPTSSRGSRDRQLGDEPPVPERSHRRPKTPDLAFADTVIVDDLPDAIPLSSDLRFNDETGIERRVASVAFPPLAAPPAPPAPPAPGAPAPLSLAGAALARPHDGPPQRGLRAAWRQQREELSELWSATAALDEDPRDPTSPRATRMTLGRRLRTLLSFFEWDRADVLRAAWIGLAVFFLAATVGAIVLRLGMR